MRCANCGAELVGEYCHAWGQRAVGDDVLAVGPIVPNLADDLLHLDFKTVRSLGLVLA
jgi:hypothetical protein